jgi:hypothetical protein
MGGLPWQNVKCKEKPKKYRKIMEAKLETNMEVLLNGFPSKNLSATNLTFRRIY